MTEYLPTHEVFVPFDLEAPQPETEQLVALVDEANRVGFTIRVAIVWSRYDLGAVPELWHMPRRFARYVGADIRAAYKSRLLIVFPDGFGFNWAGHSPAAEDVVLAKIHMARSPAGLVRSTRTAVKLLAAASGVELGAPAGSKQDSRSRDRLVIALAALGAAALAVLLRLALRRRRR